jgi:hypothetical protein
MLRMKNNLLYILNIILIFLIIITILYFVYLKIKNRYIKELFSNDIDNRYIITLSTIPVNFDTILPKTIESLLNIEKFDKVEKIIINIPKKYNFRLNGAFIEEIKINQFIDKYKNTKIYLNIVDNDYGPGTKLVGALEKNLIKFEDDNLYIIVLDDDSLYKKDLITSFEKHNKSNFNKIKFASAETHSRDTNNIKIGKGNAGMYIKSNLLKKFIDYFNKIKNLDYVLYHDDIYISYYFYLDNIIVYDTRQGAGGWIHSRIDNDTQLHKIEGKYNRKELNKKVIDILENNFKKDNIIENFDNFNWLFNISKYENKITSQGKQDGVIKYIIDNIYIKNKFCVEFGYDSDKIDGGGGPNTLQLIKNNWDYLLIDGKYNNPSINLYKHILTTDNICEIFEKYKVPKEPGYISIDVDSTDIWLCDKILEKYDPSFFSIEFNPNFPINYAIAFPNDGNVWEKDRCMGSSLKAIKLMVDKHQKYELVYAGNYKTSQHHDAFFIRKDLITNMIIPEFNSFKDTHHHIHKPCKNNREEILLDYEHFLISGDIIESKNKAKQVAKKYLCD